MYKIVNGIDSIGFDKYLSRSRAPQCRFYNSKKLQCMHSRVDAFMHSFFVNTPFVWNSIPIDVLESPSYPSFKCSLRNTLSLICP